MCATVRLRRNQIKVLDPGGVPIFSHSGKSQILHDFYKQLLGTSSNIEPISNLAVLMAPTALDNHQKELLVAPFCKTELRSALWSMKNDPSLGPDGFGPAFYKDFWNLTNSSLFTLLEEFHDLKAELSRINQFLIVLLPK
jgi:hypothetical protein